MRLLSTIGFVCGFPPLLFALRTANPSRELHIFGHDRHAFAVNGAVVRVFEQAHEMRFRRFLQGQYSRALPPVGLLVIFLLHLPHEAGKGQPPDQQIGTLLIRADFLQGSFTWT
jgi:hypothetical protein